MTGFRSLGDEIAASAIVAGDGGVGLVLYRLRRGARAGPVRLVGHCNGFAAGAYVDILEALAADGEDVFAFDQRGHGGADAPDPRDETACAPDRFACDLAAIVEAVAALRPGAPIRYAGHSLSAVAALHLAAAFPARLAALPLASLLLFEPPVFPPPGIEFHAECRDKNRALIARTRLRRALWPSREAYAAALAGRGAFAAFAPGQLARLAAATLRPEGDGFALACVPATEAAVFASFGTAATFALLDRVAAAPPIHLVSGDPGVGPGRDWATAAMPALARALPQARLTTLAGRGHLMLFEAPDECLSLLRGRVSSD